MSIKLAFFSPLPPARSGIADYSAALLDELGRLVEVETFSSKPAHFDLRKFDERRRAHIGAMREDAQTGARECPFATRTQEQATF